MTRHAVRLLCAVAVSLFLFGPAPYGHAASAWDTYKQAKAYAEGGLNTPRDYARARDLYLQVAKGQDKGAAKWASFQLGKLYSKPPLQDEALAKKYFRAAIKLGELWSARYLIEIYGREKPTAANRGEMRKLLALMRKSDSQKIRTSARTLAKQYGLND